LQVSQQKETMNYLYLHGFASTPQSTKAIYLRNRFHTLNQFLHIPDLNQNDFFSLTLTRQIQQCENILSNYPGEWSIIGSSFGGLTATWLAQHNVAIKQLVLLAPAFYFRRYWQRQLGTEQLRQWQQTGSIDVYHYGAQRSLPLSYLFWQDASQYHESDLQRDLPTLIFHGTNDDTIPAQSSHQYLQSKVYCELIEINSDHALIDVMDEIWERTQPFLHLKI
jgi:uncharacterized protein